MFDMDNLFLKVNNAEVKYTNICFNRDIAHYYIDGEQYGRSWLCVD